MQCIAIFCQSLKSIKILVSLIALGLLFFFYQLHLATKYDDIFCHEMLHNGTSQGGSLDSWHTTGCAIHKYSQK